MLQDIHSMLLLMTQCQECPCYLVRTDLSLELHVDVTWMNIKVECGRCFASHAVMSEANMLLTLQTCF